VIEDIKRAAADKDFKKMRLIMPRANKKSLLDGKIMELDEMVA